MIVLHRHDELDVDTYWKVVLDHEPVTIDPAALDRVSRQRQAMEQALADGAMAYGVNTGLGYFAKRTIPESEQLRLQQAIIVGRAAGVGPPMPESVVRGTMLLRLNGFLAGFAGVTPGLCTFIADRLNSGWCPVVPHSRPGSAGEIIPLCHLFQTFTGEGEVFVDGEHRSAASALQHDGVERYVLQLKEGNALINGAPLAAALGAQALRRCDDLLEQATVIGALTASSMGASWRPYSRWIADAKADPGQRHVTQRLAAFDEGHRMAIDASQAPVSVRVLPQVHGAAHDVVGHLREQVERELRAVTDSPMYVDGDIVSADEPAGFYPSGNFHSQALSFALDTVAIAMAQVAALSEKRLLRLLDTRFSGLPDQLAADAERGGSGLVSLHKSVVGLIAENRMYAAPASINAADTSAGQEDFQAFTGLAASKLDALLDNVVLVLAAELAATRQAHGLGATHRSPALEGIAIAVASRLPMVDHDQPLSPILERSAELIETGAVVAHASRNGPR